MSASGNRQQALANQVSESVEFLRSKTSSRPAIGIVLGSGLGGFGDLLIEKTTVDTKTIPHYPRSSVPGHAGKIHFGKIPQSGIPYSGIADGKKKSAELLVFQGRVHFYETNDLAQVVYPIDVAAALGIKKLIVTNAGGAINRQFAPGDLMFITDYLNMTFKNPLRGRNPKGASWNKTLRPAFSRAMLAKAKDAARENGIPYKEGVYCWTKGPAYESAAEIQMIDKLGADAVGMSTVPEVIVAAEYGIEVLGISCITNLATGLSSEKLSHAEVTVVANRVKQNFTTLVSKIVFAIGEDV
ncbi:MAG: purine-nucleoside phosphorylase [Bacteroidota bacterium]|nr:purine-nucleoside phosphorylase [Bacteroidota bacterium]